MINFFFVGSKIDMTDYEKIREMRIAQNKMKMKEMGVTTMAYELFHPKKSKKKSKKVFEGTDEYTPSDEENQLSDENDVELRKNTINLRTGSKKVFL